MANSLPVLILAGGFGTRLEKISKGTPKALMPVGNGFYLDLLSIISRLCLFALIIDFIIV